MMASTGAGKAKVMQWILEEATALDKDTAHPRRPISTIFFDRKGGDDVDLPAQMSDTWLHVSVCDSGRIGLQHEAHK